MSAERRRGIGSRERRSRACASENKSSARRSEEAFSFGGGGFGGFGGGFEGFHEGFHEYTYRYESDAVEYPILLWTVLIFGLGVAYGRCTVRR